MNTTSLPPPESPTPSVPSSFASEPQPDPVRASRSGRMTSLLLAATMIILLVSLWWVIRDDIHSLRNEMARRLQSAELTAASNQSLLKNTQDSLRILQGKVTLLESKQAEAQNQQLALEQLYQESFRNRDEWALAEIEQVLSIAAQQLQLAGNVQGAMIALQDAERNLAESNQPQFTGIRRAIANDLERLKALPMLDLTGIALRLDSIITQVDRMPLLSDERPVEPTAEPKQATRQGAGAKTSAIGQDGFRLEEWISRLNDQWQSIAAEIYADLRQLIRVRTVESPDALLLSPSQSYFAKENLKLRLLNARLALLSRNESAFRSDLIAAQQIISKYFDTRAKQTQTVQALLKQVQGSDLSIETPTLAESLTAVRDYKAQP